MVFTVTQTSGAAPSLREDGKNSKQRLSPTHPLRRNDFTFQQDEIREYHSTKKAALLEEDAHASSLYDSKVMNFRELKTAAQFERHAGKALVLLAYDISRKQEFPQAAKTSHAGVETTIQDARSLCKEIDLKAQRADLHFNPERGRAALCSLREMVSSLNLWSFLSPKVAVEGTLLDVIPQIISSDSSDSEDDDDL